MQEELKSVKASIRNVSASQNLGYEKPLVKYVQLEQAGNSEDTMVYPGRNFGNQQHHGSPGLNENGSVNRLRGRCFHCNQDGHWKRECP